MDLITRFFPLVLAAGLQTAAPTVEPGFTTLFNGKDFTGWKISGAAESFTIQDGTIGNIRAVSLVPPGDYRA